jgi:hypothetical protein
MVAIFEDPSLDVNYWARFLMQVFIILVIVRIMGWFLALIKQPPVSKDFIQNVDDDNILFHKRSLVKLLLV